MIVIFYIFVFIFGLTVGSFLNCIIYRTEQGTEEGQGRDSPSNSPSNSALKGRSYCPKCKHQLAWYDLIPVLSFIILKGKCRYCGKKISLQYPLVEIGTAMLFVLIFNHTLVTLSNSEGSRGQWIIDGILHFVQDDNLWLSIFNFQNLINILFLFTIASFLIIIFVYDLKHYIIPDKVIYPAIIIAGIFNFQIPIFNQAPIFNFQLNNFYSVLISAFGAAAFFLAIVLITKGKGMGIGDIKLAFLMGLLLGWPNIFVALFLAFLIGAIIGIGLILARKKTLKSEIPFGPFLVTGTFIAMFYGNQIIEWYFKMVTF